MMAPARGRSRVRPAVAGHPARRTVVAGLALLIAACGGGSSSGGGTANSPFVGTYEGVTSVTVSSTSGTAAASESVMIFVNRDGLVQVGDAQSTIYASGPLQGNDVRIDSSAATLVHPQCEGTITLAGAFQTDGEGGASFEGSWSSADAACFGAAGNVDGSMTASRINTNARASRVFETSSPALLRAFREATR